MAKTKKKRLPSAWASRFVPILGVMVFAIIGTLFLQQLFAAPAKKISSSDPAKTSRITPRPIAVAPTTLTLDGSTQEVVVSGSGLASARAKVGGIEATTISSSSSRLTLAVDTNTLLERTSIKQGETRLVSVELTADGVAATSAPTLTIARP